MSADPPRHILFLQGPPSLFWTELADVFAEAGAGCSKIHFALGDRIFWRRTGAVSYRGRFADWAAFLDRFLRDRSVTDIFYYADRFPYHVVAQDVARAHGIRCHAVENGYLRPDWLTHESGGMGRHSAFPRDPEAIRALAEGVPRPDFTVRFRHSFAVEAVNDVAFNLANYFGRPLYPRYRADRYYDTLLDYLSWLPKSVRTPPLKRAAEAAGTWPAGSYWLIAMQLQSDYMIRENSPYRHLRDMLDEVFGSFAAHGPRDQKIVVKLHPLDGGMENWGKAVPAIAARHGLADRISVIDGGDLSHLLRCSNGTVVVNSTVGLHSINAGRPTIALGSAVYDIHGLTHRSGLDRFWSQPEAPDPDFLDLFVRALAAEIQVRGDFYDPEGRAAGCRAIVARTLYGTRAAPW